MHKLSPILFLLCLCLAGIACGQTITFSGTISVTGTVSFNGPASTCGAPTYNCTRTDVIAQPYPVSIPCPSAGGCADGGALTGSNYYFTPTDFATPILRVTDANTPSNSSHSSIVNCGGSAETNVMDSSDAIFYICDLGTAIRVMNFNSSVPSVAIRYSSYVVPGCGQGTTANLFFSFTQSLIGYATCFNSSGNPIIAKFDFTSPTVGPTVGNGGVTTLVDLSTCVGALAGVGNLAYLDDVTVSQDDQTFTAVASTTSGQGSAGVIYAVVWNRTLGCRVWNSNTQSVSGTYGGAPTGAVVFTGNGVTPPVTSAQILHNARVSPGGQWVKITFSGSTVAENYWQINTLNIYQGFDDSTNDCGHSAAGYNKTVNQCASSGSHFQNIFIRAYNLPGTQTQLPATLPATTIVPWDSHSSWNGDNNTDTAPFFLTSEIGQFTPRGAWDNEWLGVATDGSGKVWRFAHTYATYLSQFFAARHAIGNCSADKKWCLWPTDWNGELGNIDGVTTPCTIGVDCRADVFLIALR